MKDRVFLRVVRLSKSLWFVCKWQTMECHRITGDGRRNEKKRKCSLSSYFRCDLPRCSCIVSATSKAAAAFTRTNNETFIWEMLAKSFEDYNDLEFEFRCAFKFIYEFLTFQLVGWAVSPRVCVYAVWVTTACDERRRRRWRQDKRKCYCVRMNIVIIFVWIFKWQILAKDFPVPAFTKLTAVWAS